MVLNWKVTEELEYPDGTTKTRVQWVQAEYSEAADEWAVTVLNSNNREERSWVDIDLSTAFDHLRDELDIEMVRLYA